MKTALSYSPLLQNHHQQQKKEAIPIHEVRKDNIDGIIDSIDALLIKFFRVFLFLAVPYLMFLIGQLFLL